MGLIAARFYFKWSLEKMLGRPISLFSMLGPRARSMSLLLQHLLVAELFQHLESRRAFADTVGHFLFFLIDRFRSRDDFLFFFLGNNHHAAAVSDDEVPRMALHSGELNFLVVGVLYNAPARRHRHRAARIDGKFEIARLVDIARSAVDHHTAQSFQFG